MELSVGSVLEGKVTGITKFGAFVTLPEGKSGLVHISEIANAFVNDVHDHLTMGQSVNVKVLSITPDGKINLSIKQTLSEQNAPRRSAPRPQNAAPSPRPAPAQWTPPERGVVRGPSNDANFEDKLKQFMQESDSRMSGNKLYADRKSGTRRRK